MTYPLAENDQTRMPETDTSLQDPTPASIKEPVLNVSHIVSELQLAANRLNAKKSTGPKSPAGKDRVRHNAVRNGFTGQVLLMSIEERPFFDKFVKGMISDLAPAGTHETFLANSIAEESWRLNQMRANCANLAAVGDFDGAADCYRGGEGLNTGIMDAVADTAVARDRAKELSLMSLYMQRTQRACERYKKELRDLQAERKAELEEARLLYQFAETNNLAWEPKEDGFVFSREKVSIYTNRYHKLNMAKRTQKDFRDKHNPVEIARAAGRVV